jgi:hypothetical protein
MIGFPKINQEQIRPDVFDFGVPVEDLGATPIGVKPGAEGIGDPTHLLKDRRPVDPERHAVNIARVMAVNRQEIAAVEDAQASEDIR